MGNKGESVTIREVYTLVDGIKKDVNSSIERLEDKFDNVINNRLKAVEDKVANIDGRMMYIPILITIAVNAFFFITSYIINKK